VKKKRGKENPSLEMTSTAEFKLRKCLANLAETGYQVIPIETKTRLTPIQFFRYWLDPNIPLTTDFQESWKKDGGFLALFGEFLEPFASISPDEAKVKFAPILSLVQLWIGSPFSSQVPSRSEFHKIKQTALGELESGKPFSEVALQHFAQMAQALLQLHTSVPAMQLQWQDPNWKKVLPIVYELWDKSMMFLLYLPGHRARIVYLVPFSQILSVAEEIQRSFQEQKSDNIQMEDLEVDKKHPHSTTKKWKPETLAPKKESLKEQLARKEQTRNAFEWKCLQRYQDEKALESNMRQPQSFNIRKRKQWG
jgi:hypothetical protein